MPRYQYAGPVQVFDKLVDQYWKAETEAPTPGKARSNLTYRYKRQMGLEPYVKVTLTASIKKLD